ncbi:hypothetical protein TPA0909_60910 [Streptomyces albus]|nr:hypothetical protein TPA0909_60910 [Streptomyces albus]
MRCAQSAGSTRSIAGTGSRSPVKVPSAAYRPMDGSVSEVTSLLPSRRTTSPSECERCAVRVRRGAADRTGVRYGAAGDVPV